MAGMDLFNSDLAKEFTGLKQLYGIYRQLDMDIAGLKKRTGLDCIPSCRSCCATSQANIEVSLFELIPLAIFLWNRNEAEPWLDRAAAAATNSPCVLYIADPKENPVSGCRYYQLRPLICRLFGFGAVRDKYGQPRPVVCKFMKLLRPDLVRYTEEELMETGQEVPDFSSVIRRAAALNPYLSESRYPINQALRLALELVGYRRSLLRSAAGYDEMDPDPTNSHPYLGRTA